MALLITDECISCGACLPECPNEAIFETRSDAETKGNHVGDGQGVGDNIYVITHDRCTECVGHFDEPQCAAVCPVDNCCIADPVYPETTDVLLEKAASSILTKPSMPRKCGAAFATECLEFPSSDTSPASSHEAGLVCFSLPSYQIHRLVAFSPLTQ